jgi:hypothetical protein
MDGGSGDQDVRGGRPRPRLRLGSVVAVVPVWTDAATAAASESVVIGGALLRVVRSFRGTVDDRRSRALACCDAFLAISCISRTSFLPGTLCVQYTHSYGTMLFLD